MSYYDYGTTANTINNASKMATGTLIWVIISIVVAIIGGVVLYFTFLSKKNEGKYKGFLGKLYDLLTFKVFVYATVQKILYLICAIATTLLSFALIRYSFVYFLVVLIFGNLVIRVLYELNLILFELFNNVKDINSKIKK